MPADRIDAIERHFLALSQNGRRVVDSELVEQLHAFLSGGRTAQVRGAVSQDDRDALMGLLEQSRYRNLLSDDGVRALERLVGLALASRQRPPQGRAVPGSVPKRTPVGHLTHLVGPRDVNLRQAVDLFLLDYEKRRASIFENSELSSEARGDQILRLLVAYARTINAAGNSPEVVHQRQALLRAFFEKPYAAVFGAQDPDQDLLGTAWEIVWGTDPEHPQSRFNKSRRRGWESHMDYDDHFVPTAEKIDKYLAARGLSAQVAATERRSPLNWIVGGRKGLVLPQERLFLEQAAISSTNVDFATKLLPKSAIPAGRTLDPTFDLRVDFVVRGKLVPLVERFGDRLMAVDRATLQELHTVAQPVGERYWRPVFSRVDGTSVSADAVTVVIKDAAGKIKGDASASSSYSAGWWGLCDRIAVQRLVTSKYGLPYPTSDVTLRVGDQTFTFAAEEIAQTIGRRLTEIFPQKRYGGNRFSGRSDQVYLHNGSVISGQFMNDVDFYRPAVVRYGDAMFWRPETVGEKKAFNGSLRLKCGAGVHCDIEAARVIQIRRSPTSVGAEQGGRLRTLDTVVLEDGTRMHGELVSRVSFAAAARSQRGELVLNNLEAAPILGDLVLLTDAGEERRVAGADIHYLVREDPEEILAEEALAFVIRNRGIFIADSHPRVPVFNDRRTVDHITSWRYGEPNQPHWVPEHVPLLRGHRGPIEKPENVVFFRLHSGEAMFAGLALWLELDENKVPINSGRILGNWDFLWSIEGRPDWNAPATLNPHMPNDLVLTLYLRSIAEPEKIASILPPNWRDYLATEQEEGE